MPKSSATRKTSRKGKKTSTTQLRLLKQLCLVSPTHQQHFLKKASPTFLRYLLSQVRRGYRKRTKLSPIAQANLHKYRPYLKRLLHYRASGNLGAARKVINQKGGIFPALIPLIAAAIPTLAKAAVGIGASAAGAAAASAIRKAIQKKK